MTHSDTFIRIHLVKDIKAIGLDDTVRIVKNLEDSVFEVTYTDRGDSLSHKVYEMTRDNVCDYVYFLLKNLTMDEDGYQSIQFDLPAMPRVLINASSLRDTSYREHFLELIENGLSMLDKVEKLSIKNPSDKKSPKNCSRYTCDLHTSAGCCEVKTNSVYNLPHLPQSPVHRYFE